MAAKRKSPASLVYEYSDKSLNETQAVRHPAGQFQLWFEEALKAGVPMPHAMILSTVTPAGKPEARTVLLKDAGKKGFVFFTNYKSAKGREIQKTPWASLLFYWPQIERQIRITGKIEKVPAKISDKYFKSRPRSYKIGAWTSPQSEVIESRKYLEQRVIELTKKFQGKTVPRPPHWGGYIVLPLSIEFWQGRSSRLHDRLRYIKTSQGTWKIERLAP